MLVWILISLSATACVTAEDGWFWHVTDFHWDFSYWSSQLSCNGVGPKSPGTFGDQWCDSPWRLVQETVAGMARIQPHVDFMLWTGDSVPHVADSSLSTQINEELVRNITTLMRSAFPGTQIYATFGNHDYYSSNLYPPHGNQIYNDTYLIWKTWINDSTQEANFFKGGYYTVLASPGLRIVALNTNLYYYKDTVTQGLPDPADQLAWLDTVLTGAATNNEKVILTGHVPPGFTTPRVVRWMSSQFNEKFVDIMLRHSDTISGMHFGHEHHDNFRILYDSKGTPKVVVFIAPSVTPWRYRISGEQEPAHNPGVRLVKYDKQTGSQLEILQYYIDLQASNSANHIVWKLGYNATDLYRIPDLSPASMHDVTKRMANRSGPEFQAYVKWYNTNGSNVTVCDQACHKAVMCGVTNLADDPFNRCLKSAYNYTKWYNYNTNGSNSTVCDQACLKAVMCGVTNLADDPFNRCLKSTTSCTAGGNSCPVVVG